VRAWMVMLNTMNHFLSFFDKYMKQVRKTNYGNKFKRHINKSNETDARQWACNENV
jgi:hypothetical protein